jgi:DNA-nicking Smr family endonuclease
MPDAERDAFQVRREGERHFGLARGIDRKHLKRLQRDQVQIDGELDLHGLTAREARKALAEAIQEAFTQDMRCLLVIHGRGRHSPGDAVLRKSLPDWLAAPPNGRLVMAFASVGAGDRGAGATTVLLRRRRTGPA